MTVFELSPGLVTVADALSVSRWPIDQAKLHVRSVPGLYAVYGGTKAWTDLGFEPQPDSALYVGKSESSLVDRELHTHFSTDPNKKPRTGRSTVRRSFAALLRETLNLHAVPRNLEKPGSFDHFGLTPDSDSRLTAWMHKRLTLAVWERTAQAIQPLEDIETAVIRHWTPPLNIRQNPRRLQRLTLARKAMALEAAGFTAPAATTPDVIFRSQLH